ncbi:hypothetical protein HID58_093868 [Brassica napus]|uniref:Uncharacterized protein n=1 Tax=Brassica napus TaxID=3708 RepID=A0ABQ7XC02_BRANA|nr:hypothetical protein HID58_093868 [Brassica napus]
MGMEGVWRCMVEWANLGRGRTELVRKCTDRTDPYGPSRPKSTMVRESEDEAELVRQNKLLRDQMTEQLNQTMITTVADMIKSSMKELRDEIRQEIRQATGQDEVEIQEAAPLDPEGGNQGEPPVSEEVHDQEEHHDQEEESSDLSITCSVSRVLLHLPTLSPWYLIQKTLKQSSDLSITCSVSRVLLHLPTLSPWYLIQKTLKQTKKKAVCAKEIGAWFVIGCGSPRQAGYSWKGRARLDYVSGQRRGQIHEPMRSISSQGFHLTNQAVPTLCKDHKT